MLFLDIKDPAKRATLVKEYVTAIKTVKQRNTVNREMKLAIGDELQTLFHPIVNATKQAAEETRKELALMKKTLTDIDGALDRATDARPRPDKNTDTTFGIHKRQDWQLGMGSKAVRLGVNGKTLIVDDTEYKFTPGLKALIMLKHPRRDNLKHMNHSLHRPRLNHSQIGYCSTTRYVEKWKHTLKKLVIHGERIAEEGNLRILMTLIAWNMALLQ